MFPKPQPTPDDNLLDEELIPTPINSKETELHGLVNNAGIMGVEFAESADGYESQFQVILTVPYI